MYKKLFYSSILILLQLTSLAQISGIKTIGGSGADYASINAAVAALNSSGVNGPVIFNVASGTYTGNFIINDISGADSINTISFVSASHDSSLVIVQSASSSSSSNNYLVKLNAAKYISFKWITFERTGIDNNSTVVELAGVCNHNSFEHCVIKNNSTSSSAFSTALVYGTNTGNNISYITFNNNVFQNGSMGIYMQGASSTSLNAGAVITNNTFTNQYRWTIALYYQNAPIINGNIISTSSSYYDFRAIYNLYSKNGLQVQNNKIYAVKGFGIRMESCIGSNFAGLITNNFISFTGSGAYAFHYSNSGSHNIYYNSINLAGGSSTGMFINGQTSSNIRFQNNIVKISSTGNCMNIDQSTNFPFLISDNNDYYFPLGYLGKWKNNSNISSLSAWRTASNWDYYSVNYDPNFVSNTDLHINGYSSISKKGTSSLTTPNVSIDIDGISRNSITPDIGADEFSFEDLGISSINVNTSYCSGESETISAYVTNHGNIPFNTNVDFRYKFGSNPDIVESMALNLNAGDSQLVTFTTPLNLNIIGNTTLSVKHLLTSDQNTSNDERTNTILVKQTPIINWPLDTVVCANNSIILDAGAGMDSYLWSTGATSQTITVDSSGIGFGARYFSVNVTSNSCSISDSVLVNFIYCAGIENAINTNDISIYPNPTTGIAYINSSILNNSTVSIYSTSGKLVKETLISNNIIDISELTNGLYFIIINSGNSQISRSILKR